MKILYTLLVVMMVAATLIGCGSNPFIVKGTATITHSDGSTDSVDYQYGGLGEGSPYVKNGELYWTDALGQRHSRRLRAGDEVVIPPAN